MGILIHKIRSIAEVAPLPGIALLASVLSLVVAAAWALHQDRALETVHQASAIVPNVGYVPAKYMSDESELPVFDSQSLHRVLTESAAVSEVSIPEVTFTLQDNDAVPYLRYRSTATVTAPYPAIRRFVSIVLAQRSNAMLESFSCVREGVELLKCELAISELYRRSHG